MTEFYLHKGNPLQTVYEVDTEAGTWKMAASKVGVIHELCGPLPDGGAAFLDTERFTRVYRKSVDGEVITFTREPS